MLKQSISFNVIPQGIFLVSSAPASHPDIKNACCSVVLLLLWLLLLLLLRVAVFICCLSVSLQKKKNVTITGCCDQSEISCTGTGANYKDTCALADGSFSE